MRGAAVVLFLCSCTITDRYLVTAETARRLEAMPVVERAATAVPAIRDGKRVFVRGSALEVSPEIHDARASQNFPAVKARAPSPMMTAGSALTWIGTAVSVAGTVLFFTFSDGDRHWAGAGLALSAEAVMGTGTGLWIAAAARHPQEVAPGRADLTYLTP
jgi:hypothetical protein